jgi:CubicO group peptidase (beta-lactamase class C family)
MLTYLDANLHPGDVGKSSTDANTQTLAAALRLSHELRADVGPNVRIAFAWLYNNATGNYWHNGATGGYSSFAAFNPKDDFAVVVLYNGTVQGQQGFADLCGEHVIQRLTGKAAIALQ